MRIILYILTGLFLILLVLIVTKDNIFSKKDLKNKPFTKNIVIISIDSLRSDHMGSYGYQKNTTPNIDKWARNATVFTNVHTVTPLTYPSFVALMTGKSPFDTKIIDNPVYYEGAKGSGSLISSATKTLAENLRSHKYLTAAFISNPQLSNEYTNINKGFDLYKVHDPVWISEDDRKPYEDFINSAIDWISNNREEKFFIWIHLMDPHLPYTPPSEFLCKVDKKNCNMTSDDVWSKEEDRQNLDKCQQNSIPKEKIDLLTSLYDGEIAYTDNLVGKILSQISNLNLDSQTIVVIYGDHGEGLDHNYFFSHGDVLYESSTKIPLIIKSPEVFSGGKTNNLLDNTQISSILLGLLLSKRTQDRSESSIFQSLISPLSYVYSINLESTKYAIQNRKYKYIYSLDKDSCKREGNQEELYNLENDPHEKINLIGENTVIKNNLQIELNKYLQKYQRSSIISDNKSEDKSEKLKMLKSLGY